MNRQSTKTIRLAFVARHGPGAMGGIEQRMRRLAPYLRKRDFRVYYLCIDRRPEESDFYHIVSFGSINSWWAHTYGWLRIHLWLVKNRSKYDVICLANILFLQPGKVVGMMISLLFYFLLSRVFKKPIIWELHGPYSLPFMLPNRFLRYLAKLSIDYFVYLNKNDLKELKSLLKVEDERVYKMINAYDPSFFYPLSLSEKIRLRRLIGIPSSAIVIIDIAGKWEENIKNTLTLLKAWVLLRKKFKNELPLYLLLIGPEMDSPRTSPRVREFIKSHKEEMGEFKFTGFLPDPSQYLRCADICFHPSFTEGFSLGVVEALACGLPVVGLKTEGMEDLIEHGKNGFLVEKNDPALFADYLSLLVKNKRLREKMSKEAFLSARPFTLERQAYLFTDLCQKAVSSKALS